MLTSLRLQNFKSWADTGPVRLAPLTDIENWPENFFGDDMADLTARTVAAANRRSHAKP